jgi:DNA repair exonuclease SbcCD ATPase subunit
MSDVIVAVDNTPKVEQIQTSGFANRSILEERIAKEEDELKSLMEQNTSKSKNSQEDSDDEDSESEPSNAEERTFKKRYGDLRRHSQKQQTDLQKQIDELKSQLEKSTKEQIKLPKSEEELAEWVKEYPDVAKIVETIAIKKAQEQSTELEARLKQLDQVQYQAKKEKAEIELMRLHPDFDQIRDQDDFHEWVEQQPEWVQKALYENETDAKSAARAIDLYKADMGIKTNKRSRKEEEKDAARGFAAGKGSAPDKGTESGFIKESDVDKMSSREYEAKQEEIVTAIKSGKFIYDLSGSAR